MPDAINPNLDVVLCPGCCKRLPKRNNGVCRHCDYSTSEGHILSLAEILAKPSFPAEGALRLGDVCPAFIQAVLDIGAGKPPPART